MTNEANKILTYLRARDLPVTHKAADLIEQLQRERDEARDRLAEAQSDAEKWRKDSILMLGFVDVLEEHGLIPSSSELLEARDRAIAKSREQGFCAGLEAAALEADGWFYDPEKDEITDPRLSIQIRALNAASAAREIAMRDRAAEEASKRYKQWKQGGPVECDFTACRDIAGAIRALPLSPDGQQALNEMLAEEWDEGHRNYLSGQNPYRKETGHDE